MFNVKKAKDFSFDELNLSQKIKELFRKFLSPDLFVAIVRFNYCGEFMEKAIGFQYYNHLRKTYENDQYLDECLDEDRKIDDIGFQLFAEAVGGENLQDFFNNLKENMTNAGYIIPDIDVYALRKEKIRYLFDFTEDSFDSWLISIFSGIPYPIRTPFILPELQNELYEKFQYDEEVMITVDKIIDKCLFSIQRDLLKGYMHNDYVSKCANHKEQIFGINSSYLTAPVTALSEDDLQSLLIAKLNLNQIPYWRLEEELSFLKKALS